MKLRLVRTSRIPPLPVWAVTITLVWAGLQVATLVLSVKAGRNIVTCPLKLLTSLPCPTCGATRGIVRLAAGDPLGAILHNPLLFAVLIPGAIVLTIRLITARTLRVELTTRQRRIFWAVAIAMLLVNWAYVITCVR